MGTKTEKWTRKMKYGPRCDNADRRCLPQVKPEGLGEKRDEARCRRNRVGPRDVVRGKPNKKLLRTELTEYTTVEFYAFYSLQSYII